MKARLIALVAIAALSTVALVGCSTEDRAERKGNVYVLNRIRRRGVMEREQTPPVGPQGWTTPSAPATGA